MKKVATNHGGAREGSGRRRSGPNSVQVNWRVSEMAKAWIIEQARIQDVSVAAIVDDLIKHATVATVRAEDIRIPHPRPDYQIGSNRRLVGPNNGTEDA